MTASNSREAPEAPGRLGEAIPAPELLRYLSGLDAWLADRRTELDRLDSAAEAAVGSESHTSDLLLGLTLWQAIRTRMDELTKLWDSGRADEVDREKMSQLIWGRLDSGHSATLVSLVEAITLCDAVIAQLRVQLSFDPSAADQAVRLRALRAGLVRSEDLAGTDTEARGRVQALRTREEKLIPQAARGADITGPLAELEAEAARTERDLIVQSSQRRVLAKQRREAESLAAALELREPTLHELADRCRREIVDPPRMAVPDVSRLGAVPESRAELDAFLARLDAVTRAFDALAEAYSAPLRERAELRYGLEKNRAKADANGRSASPTVQSGLAEATAAIEQTPCDLALARFLAEQYQFLTRDLPASGRDGASR